jgi:mono/diheme cytochrome c family protein
MTGFRKFVITIVLLGGFGVLGAYAALPYVWSPNGTRDFSQIKGDVKRGEYVARLAGCVACHTDAKRGGAYLAGGRDFKTPYGIFRSPNISPDKSNGIGNWSLTQFSDALTKGLSPTGEHYYPAFPYTSYAKMTTQDISDLWAYIKTVEPQRQENADHDLSFPFNQRRGLGIWKALYFDDSPFQPNSNQSETWNRGAYIVNGPGHCVECHTPRNFLGGLDITKNLKGTSQGPEGEKVPGITRDPQNGIGEWTDMDLTFLLQLGLTPNGDAVGGAMGEVVQDSTAHYTQEDISAVSNYLLQIER